jgi:hypothetical protein
MRGAKGGGRDSLSSLQPSRRDGRSEVFGVLAGLSYIDPRANNVHKGDPGG